MNRLVTIPISHYCEKARWALDRAGIAYVEDPHLQAFHYIATLRAGGGVTAPVMTHPGGVLPDSNAIMRWADAQQRLASPLYPADRLGDPFGMSGLEAGDVIASLIRRLITDGALMLHAHHRP